MLQAMKLSKVKWIPVLWLAGIFSSQAQNSDERPLSDSAKVTKQADLSEVVIRGERMVTKHDRRLYYPTSEELERSPTVYSLLKRIPMPGVRIDETKQSVTSNLGYVPLYINDKVATQDELQSLTMQSIVRIEYIDRPGMRYGDNAYGVIRIITRRVVAGQHIGGNEMTAVDRLMNNTSGYVTLHHNASTFSLNYGGTFNDFRNGRSIQETCYQMADGSQMYRTLDNKTLAARRDNHHVQLRYAYTQPQKWDVQASFTTGKSRSPKQEGQTDEVVNGIRYQSQMLQSNHSFMPCIDFYTSFRPTERQTLIFDVAGSWNKSSQHYTNAFPEKIFNYTGKGKSRAFSAGILYENALKPFTFTFGANYKQQYISNHYAGDVNQHSRLRSSHLNSFAEITGKLWKVTYQLGTGVSRSYFNQGGKPIDEWFVRPKLTLSLPFSKRWQIRYSFTYSPFISRMQYVTDITVQKDPWTIVEGNPQLHSAHRTEQILDLSYNHPRVFSTMSVSYRDNRDAVMQRIYRNDDGLFVFTHANQPACRMFYVNNYTQVQLIPEKLKLSLSGGYYYFYNRGTDYLHKHHRLNGTLWLTADISRFSIEGAVDSGWGFTEGENRSISRPTYNLSLQYRVPLRSSHALTLGVSGSQLFQLHYLREKVQTLNRFVQQHTRFFSPVSGNLFLFTLNWKFSSGVKIEGVNQRIKAQKADSGLIE